MILIGPFGKSIKIKTIIKKERPVDGEEKSEGGDSLLSSRKVGHGLEPLPRSHAVVVDPLKVGFFRVLGSKEGLGRLVAGQGLVDPVDGVADVLEALVEEVVALLLHTLELHLGLLGPLADAVEVLVGLLQLLPGFLKLLHRFHVGRLNTKIL